MGLGGLLLIVFAPNLWLQFYFRGRIYRALTPLPPRAYGLVFGARVNDDFSLTDVTRERVEAALLLYERGLIEKLYVSGDNRHNREADTIAGYARQRGVAAEDLLVDPLGIDTHDTCRHFAQIAADGVLLTQTFHLPRAMWMCEREGVRPIGLAVNHLGLLPVRGDDALQIYATRIGRSVREATLTWAYLLGLYEALSDEAEQLEANRNS